MTVTTTADVEARMVRQLTAEETRVVGQLIGDVEAELAGWLGRPLTVRTVVGERPGLVGWRWPVGVMIPLEATPVTSVSRVEVGGVDVTADAVVRGWGLLLPWAVATTVEWDEVVVDYTGGLAGSDPTSDFGAALRGVVADLVIGRLGRLTEQTTGVSRMSAEGFSVDVDAEWEDRVRRRLARWRRPRVGVAV